MFILVYEGLITFFSLFLWILIDNQKKCFMVCFLKPEVAGAGNNCGLHCPLLVGDANVERSAPSVQNKICSPLGESL